MYNAIFWLEDQWCITLDFSAFLFGLSEESISCFLDLILPSPVSVINKTIEEDRFDIPDVPMEEDWLFVAAHPVDGLVWNESSSWNIELYI